MLQVRIWVRVRVRVRVRIRVRVRVRARVRVCNHSVNARSQTLTLGCATRGGCA